MTISRRSISFILIFIVGIAYSFMLDVDSVSAATVKTPGKPSISVSLSGQSAVLIKWKKVKNAKGYQIYMNNKAVKKVGAKATSFKKTGLKANTKYAFKVRAYNTYKQKQYYNSKTKKWQKKKPAKKNWKGKKTRKVTAYKYGKFSAVKNVTTPKGTSGKKQSANSSAKVTNDTKATNGTTPAPAAGGTGSTSSSSTPLFEPREDITFLYTNSTIYLGQTWSNDIHNKLNTSSSGYEKISRSNFYEYEKWANGQFVSRGIYNLDLHIYDTGDYNNFLIVYVSNNQIVGWYTNRNNMGKEGTNTLNRGDTDFPEMLNVVSYDNRQDVFSNYRNYAMIAGGFAYNEAMQPQDNWPQNVNNERKIAIHVLKSLRYLYNGNIGAHRNVLAGLDNNGNPLYYNGSRFGAQAWAETTFASNKLVHNGVMTAGPMAVPGQVVSSQRDYAEYFEYDFYTNTESCFIG